MIAEPDCYFFDSYYFEYNYYAIFCYFVVKKNTEI